MRRRFAIRFDSFYRVISLLSFLPPADAHVTLDGDEVAVRMAWGFRARFPRAAVADVKASAERPLSRGVHGWRGDWLVNGAGGGLVEVLFDPPMRARVVGFPVRVRRLRVAVDDPDGLVSALGGEQP